MVEIFKRNLDGVWFYIRDPRGMIGIDATPGKVRVIPGDIPDYVFTHTEITESNWLDLLVLTGLSQQDIEDALEKISEEESGTL